MSEAYVHEHMEYSETLGGVVWKKRPWRTRSVIGALVGTCRARYRVVNAQRRQLYCHHVVWFLVNNAWPKHELDHKNLDGCDNRIDNLREATRLQNARNVISKKRTAKGRLKGAFTHPDFGNRWHAQIVVDRKQIYLGSFKSEQEAHDAYCRASQKYHGEFSRAA